MEPEETNNECNCGEDSCFCDDYTPEFTVSIDIGDAGRVTISKPIDNDGAVTWSEIMRGVYGAIISLGFILDDKAQKMFNDLIDYR